MRRLVRYTRWPFDEKPLLVFWETTKACLLACKHCRAEAIEKPLPGELTTEEGLRLVDEVASFGSPYPILVFTGGDPLMRADLWDLVVYAREKGVRVALAPSVTPLLTETSIKKTAEAGVSAVSISLDGASSEVHDGVRGVPGTWAKTLEAIKLFKDYGVKVQVNTTIMRPTLFELPKIVSLLEKLEVQAWELFYFVKVGRGASYLDLEPWEWEEVSHFLYDASFYGLTLRTVEGPMFRRIALARHVAEREGLDHVKLFKLGGLYKGLLSELKSIAGPTRAESKAETTGTRDGKGVVFIANNGDVCPSGFLPVAGGNVRREGLKRVYLESEFFKKLRRAEFQGRCGRCEFRQICGGSRARAYSATGNPLGEDPACPYIPGSYMEFGLNVEVPQL
ncbi:MAG: TIGR04053 family radical SAM/SPASM domain-containing protein [Acidilobaceae archaeon]